MKLWVRERLEKCHRKDFTGNALVNFNQGNVTSIVVTYAYKPPKEVITGTVKEIYGKKANTTE